jgi:hypothetical protein
MLSGNPTDDAISVHVKVLPDHFEAIGAQVLQSEFGLADAASPSEAEVMVATIDPDAAGAGGSSMPPGKLTRDDLARSLGIAGQQSEYDVGSLKILRQGVMFHRYEAAERTCSVLCTLDTEATEAGGRTLSMPIGPPPAHVKDGHSYLVTDVNFELNLKNRDRLEWRACIEADTGAVLYLEALVGGINGLVFVTDPTTSHGGPSAAADNAQLNLRRASVPLHGLNGQADPQSLVGPNVEIDDFSKLPVADIGGKAPPPTKPKGESFDYQARTNDFASVNAYYHCDRFIRLVEELGFNRSEYFPGTRFPLSVDARGMPLTEESGNVVNAECRGTFTNSPEGSTIRGIDRIVFCLAENAHLTEPMGNASDWRVVLHELGGHGVLYNHVGSSRFRFSHTAGDSLAAILNDPQSQASDKGMTFPWTRYVPSRRHDRSVASGWGWDSALDQNDGATRLKREQILSSTHVRLYQAIGGSDIRLSVRLFAAKFATYLILRAIQTLTPLTNPRHASDWLCALIVADACNWESEGHAGGAYEKVIRWAFEQQDLFGGSPPDVDVYIDDGRGGGYAHQPSLGDCPAIWNRHAADGVGIHQAPVPGINQAYVKVRNCGVMRVGEVTVRAFQGKPHSRLVYPDDFEPMEVAQLVVQGSLDPSGELIVGPFAWVPAADSDNHLMMAVSAEGDPSNIEKFDVRNSISACRLVPHDNNLGMRRV